MYQEPKLLIQKPQLHNIFHENIEVNGHFPACQVGGKPAKINLTAMQQVSELSWARSVRSSSTGEVCVCKP